MKVTVVNGEVVTTDSPAARKALGLPVANAHQGTSPTNKQPANSNTGSASAALQGTTTSGTAKTGQSGSLNVPITPAVTNTGTGGGGGGGGGGGTTGTGLSGNAADATFGFYGLPSDVQAEVDQIFANTADVNAATQLALAYIRGTDWYAQTYPGIQQGIQNGVVGSEADYRAYVNQINQLTLQYYGRQATSQDIANYLGQGFSVGRVGQGFQGQAYVTANRPALQYQFGAFGDGRLSDDQLTALGNESAGIDTALGQQIQNQLKLAQQRIQRVFQGTAATPSLSVGTNGLSAPSLQGQRAGAPDVTA